MILELLFFWMDGEAPGFYLGVSPCFEVLHELGCGEGSDVMEGFTVGCACGVLVEEFEEGIV